MPDQLALLRKAWEGLRHVPGGGKLFGKLIGRAAPYTGTISPEVVEVRRGYARVRMEDRKQVRNHLRSIHAVALVNLAEACSGLAFTFALPPRTRAILTGISIEYIKKARGVLEAECYPVIPETNERSEHEIEVVTRDEDGDIVTRARARWLIGPLK